MNSLEINNKMTLVDVINSVLELNSNKVLLNIEEGSVLFENKINLNILVKLAKDRNISLELKTSDPLGKKMIRDTVMENDESGELNIDRYLDQEIAELHISKSTFKPETSSKKMLSLELPKISMPSLDFSFLKENKFLPIFLGFWIVVLFGGYFYLNSSVKADVEIFVQAERFVKSLEVRLSTTKSTDVDNKIFKGEPYIQTITIIEEIETTGKIDSGKKAIGQVTLTNKTDSEIVLKKGAKIEYKSGSKDLVYLTTSEYTIDARKVESTSPNVYVNTTKVIDVEAFDFGSGYNLELNKEVLLDGKSSDLVSGLVTKAISGGSKSDIKAVSSEDIKKVYEVALSRTRDSFKPFEEPGKVFLRGSEQFTVSKSEYTGKAGDALDKLKLTLTVDARGLKYDTKDAENFVKASMKSILPKGFEVYGKDLEVEINLLGKTNSSTLTVDEGDVQVTVKTYKIPVLDTSEIKSMLLGKKFNDAEEIIKNIPNVIRYNISFNYPLFNSIPSNPERVNVSISKE